MNMLGSAFRRDRAGRWSALDTLRDEDDKQRDPADRTQYKNIDSSESSNASSILCVQAKREASRGLQTLTPGEFQSGFEKMREQKTGGPVHHFEQSSSPV